MTPFTYRYTGKEQDDSTGLYFYEARYYDPVLGRFISADTIVPDPTNPQSMNRYSYVRNNPLRYTDPSGHCEIVCLVVIGATVGATVGGVQAGLASDWDLKATLIGAGIGGAAGAVGAGVGGAIAGSTSVQAVLQAQGALVVGAVAGGAVGGLTSAVLSRAAGYDTDIGLAVAAGAAGGLVGGSLGSHAMGLDPAGMASAAIGAAAAGGAVSSTISGADPGMGALFAAGGAALGVAASYVYQESQKQAQVPLKNARRNFAATRVDQSGQVLAQACTTPHCSVNGQIVGMDNQTGDYLLDIQLNSGETGPINVEIQGRHVLSDQGPYESRLGSTSLGTTQVPLQGGPIRIPPPTVPYGKAPNIQQGEGNYIDLKHGPKSESSFRVPGWRSQ